MPVQKTKKPAQSRRRDQAGSHEERKAGESAGTDGQRSGETAPSPPAQAKAQFAAFERAIALLHKRNFREAKDMFEKARQGRAGEMASNATMHVRMCERRLTGAAPSPNRPRNITITRSR